MEIYTGCDVIEVDRIKNALKEEGFKEKVFTKKEIEYCESKSELTKYQHYAVRFCAKEAIFKALTPIIEDKFSISWKNAQITNNTDGRPMAKLLNIEPNLINANLDNIKIDVSLSHIKEIAMATAVIYRK